MMHPTKLTAQYFMLHHLITCKPQVSYMEANAIVFVTFHDDETDMAINDHGDVANPA